MSVQQQFGNQVRFVGVPGLAAFEEMGPFVSRHGASAFPHIPDPGGEIWRRFGVVQQRTYVVINDDGTWRRTGYGNLAGEVQALINS
ncbi:MAG: hypothetical protein AAF567_25860 [Actinomycetota bacterium]